MKELKHTPGVWTNHGRILDYGPAYSAVGAKTLIARVYSESVGDTDQEQANANLIAAAPDMLQALQAFVENSSVQVNAPNECEAAEIAIAKATGGAA